MANRATDRRRAVVALGGNALLRRGEPLEAANQARAARDAARVLAPAFLRHQLVITHGDGPQVGLLALMSDAYTETAPYPLDVLDAETAGQIGYVLEMQLDNSIDHQETVTVITRIVVDADDPAFESPSKFIGPVYTEDRASELADRYGWTVQPRRSAHGRRTPECRVPGTIVPAQTVGRNERSLPEGSTSLKHG
jgi:carbamate kinase